MGRRDPEPPESGGNDPIETASIVPTELEIRVRRLHRRDINKTWEFLKRVFRDVNRETVEDQRPRHKRHFLEIYEEEGVEQVVLSELVPDVEFGASDSPTAAKIKGDVRMASVVAKAARDRQRPLKTDLVVPFGLGLLRLTVADSERCLLYTSPSPRDRTRSRMPSSA